MWIFKRELRALIELYFYAIIYLTVLSKLFILPGMAEINIAEIDTLEKKSKKDLILLSFKK